MLPDHHFPPAAGKGKHIEFDNVGQNTVELWTLESGGGWIHPVHIHLVVRVIVHPLLHFASRLPPCLFREELSTLQLAWHVDCRSAVRQCLLASADVLVVHCRTSSASRGRALIGTPAPRAAESGSRAPRSWSTHRRCAPLLGKTHAQVSTSHQQSCVRAAHVAVLDWDWQQFSDRRVC
jgi:hypothetical protein